MRKQPDVLLEFSAMSIRIVASITLKSPDWIYSLQYRIMFNCKSIENMIRNIVGFKSILIT